MIRNALVISTHSSIPLQMIPPGGQRRQDIVSSAILPAAAVGALSAGLTPMTIFSNLLNAYATMDSKHDITGKLVESASNWLVGGGGEQGSPDAAAATSSQGTTGTTTTTSTATTTTRTTSRSISTTSSATTTSTTTTSPFTTAFYRQTNYGGTSNYLPRIEDPDPEPYRPYQAVVVDSLGLPPVKSNVDPSQPLRSKPPSEQLHRVTPGQPIYINNNRVSFDRGASGRYGIR